MIEVIIPKEINEYEDKVMFGLTFRQIISTILSIVISIFLYTSLLNIINEEILSYLIIILDGAILSIGWVKYNGMRAEQFAFVFLEHNLYPQKRGYEDCNIYEGINNEVVKKFYKENKQKGVKKFDKAQKEK